MSEAGATILVLDDDKGICTQYRWLLSGHRVVAAFDREEAVSLFTREQPAAAIVDLGLPPDPDGASEGLAAVSQFLQIYPHTKIIVVTGQDTHEHAVRAIALGAYDFLRKPVEPDVLSLTVERALRLHELEQENRRLAATAPQSMIAGIMGQSPQMQKILRDVERVAKTDISVLILGESGTGKELIANSIHRLSQRKAKPFVAINCAAIPEGLLESELFGYEKGAFTGAMKQTIGKIEMAHEGTLFLDEVGDIPMSMQVKLLRFLEDQVIERVGGRRPIQVETRVICATNQNLQQFITEGRFREDLYYRMNEFTVTLPPLREREGDVVLLANFFLRQYSAQFNRACKGFAPEAVAALNAHSWRGNVRELENRVKRAVVMCESPVVVASDLELAPPAESISFNLNDARSRAEKNAINMALAQTNGNVSRAAQLLGISRPTLYDLVKQHGISLRAEASLPDTEGQRT
ncbi:MAG: PEP-CTERM-box response regulator transcription factor [Rhizomicrobium sp.]